MIASFLGGAGSCYCATQHSQSFAAEDNSLLPAACHFWCLQEAAAAEGGYDEGGYDQKYGQQQEPEAAAAGSVEPAMEAPGPEALEQAIPPPPMPRPPPGALPPPPSSFVPPGEQDCPSCLDCLPWFVHQTGWMARQLH
jgi:hypothetical protein